MSKETGNICEAANEPVLEHLGLIVGHKATPKRRDIKCEACDGEDKQLPDGSGVRYEAKPVLKPSLRGFRLNLRHRLSECELNRSGETGGQPGIAARRR